MWVICRDIPIAMFTTELWFMAQDIIIVHGMVIIIIHARLPGVLGFIITHGQDGVFRLVLAMDGWAGVFILIVPVIGGQEGIMVATDMDIIGVIMQVITGDTGQVMQPETEMPIEMFIITGARELKEPVI